MTPRSPRGGPVLVNGLGLGRFRDQRWSTTPGTRTSRSSSRGNGFAGQGRSASAPGRTQAPNKEPAGTTTNTSANGPARLAGHRPGHPDGQADLRYTENSRSCSRRRYDKRAGEYVQKLEELQKYGKDKLAASRTASSSRMHDSLGYFCRAYGLELVDSIMPQPGVERTTPNWLNWSRPAPMRVSASLP